MTGTTFEGLGLAALAAGLRGTLTAFGEVATPTPLLTHVAVFSLLLLVTLTLVIAVLVALLAGL